MLSLTSPHLTWSHLTPAASDFTLLHFISPHLYCLSLHFISITSTFLCITLSHLTWPHLISPLLSLISLHLTSPLLSLISLHLTFHTQSCCCFNFISLYLLLPFLSPILLHLSSRQSCCIFLHFFPLALTSPRRPWLHLISLHFTSPHPCHLWPHLARCHFHLLSLPLHLTSPHLTWPLTIPAVSQCASFYLTSLYRPLAVSHLTLLDNIPVLSHFTWPHV